MFSEWLFERGSFTTPYLDAEELDIIIQRVAPLHDVWYTFDTSPMFRISAHRWWSEESGHFVRYKIYFPRSVWKKVRANLSDEQTFENLLTEG